MRGHQGRMRFECKDHPIHLRDALTGELRNTYRPFNHVDEAGNWIGDGICKILQAGLERAPKQADTKPFTIQLVGPSFRCVTPTVFASRQMAAKSSQAFHCTFGFLGSERTMMDQGNFMNISLG